MDEAMQMWQGAGVASMLTVAAKLVRTQASTQDFRLKFVCWDDAIPPSQQTMILTVFKMQQKVLLLYDMSRSFALEIVPKRNETLPKGILFWVMSIVTWIINKCFVLD